MEQRKLRAVTKCIRASVSAMKNVLADVVDAEDEALPSLPSLAPAPVCVRAHFFLSHFARSQYEQHNTLHATEPAGGGGGARGG